MTNPVVVHRRVARPVDEVWTLCTTPDGLSRWWWPMYPDTVYDIDPRPLHRYRFSSRSGAVGVSGDYIVVERFHVLEFSWVRDDLSPVTDHVRLVLNDDDAGTTIVLTHTITEPTPDRHSDLAHEWHALLDRLVSVTD